MSQNEPRRNWLRDSLIAVGGTATLATATRLAGPQKSKKGEGTGDEDEDVSPAEDLMREHGILKGVLLVYREVMNRIDSQHDFPSGVVMSSAKLIRTFVEDYHEIRKANKLVDLVDVLLQQHQKGRVLTDRTMQLATASSPKDASQRTNLRNVLYQFVRMYEPHEAREDTVLFPQFRKIVSKHEYDALGEEFEKKENQIFRGDGLEKNVDAVARLEKELGIYDLGQFTPKV